MFFFDSEIKEEFDIKVNDIDIKEEPLEIKDDLILETLHEIDKVEVGSFVHKHLRHFA